MAYGVGCIGMSIDDFDRCTPFEFIKIAESYNQLMTDTYQREWERTRIEAFWSVRPWAKPGLRPTDVVPLPWDTGGSDGAKKQTPLSRHDEPDWDAIRKARGIG